MLGYPAGSKLRKASTQPTYFYFLPAIELHRPAIELHPPAIILHRPAIELHRPAIELHPPAIILHRPAIELHRPAIENDTVISLLCCITGLTLVLDLKNGA
ncbi:MAG: hypothetical protein ACSI46_25830 [Gloeotrichia echinulata DVL01]